MQPLQFKYYALVTFPERKHLAHTFILFGSPSITAFTLLKFGFHVLVVLLLMCERVILNLLP